MPTNPLVGPPEEAHRMGAEVIRVHGHHPPVQILVGRASLARKSIGNHRVHECTHTIRVRLQ